MYSFVIFLTIFEKNELSLFKSNCFFVNQNVLKCGRTKEEKKTHPNKNFKTIKINQKLIQTVI